MADAPIIGRHKLYKLGSERLACWMIEASHASRNSTELFSDRRHEGHQPSLGRLDVDDNGQRCMTIQDLLTLAKIIADDNSIEIPSTILEISRDVITAREVCAKMYRSQCNEQSGSIAAEDDRHADSLAILKEVHSLLAAARSKRSSSHVHDELRNTIGDAGAPLDRENEKEALQNLFENLQAEEPMNDAWRSSPVIITSPENTDSSRSQHSNKFNDDNDTLFVLWCLFQDFDAVRKWVRDLWTKHATGERSSFAAGVVTDTAMALMERLYRDYALMINEYPDYRQLWGTWAGNGTFSGNKSSLSAEEILGTFYVDAVEAVHLLGEQLKVIDLCIANGTPVSHDELDGIAARATPGLSATLVRSIKEMFETRRTMEQLHEAWGITTSIITDDTLLKSLFAHTYDASRRGRLQVPLVLNLQLNMTIHEILGGRTFGAMASLARVIRKTTDSNTDIITHPSEQMQTVGSIFLERAKWLAAPFCLYTDDGSRLKGTNQPASRLAISLPTIASTAQLHVQLNSLGFGIEVYNNDLDLPAMAHLYRAGQHYGLITNVWEDLELVLSHVIGTEQGTGVDGPVVSQLPSGSDGYPFLGYYRRTLGRSSSLEELYNGPYTFDHVAGGKGTRVVAPKSLLARKLLEPWREGRLSRLATTVYSVAVETLIEEGEGETRTSLVKPAAVFTATSLLGRVEQELAAIEPLLNFDHVSFGRDCAGMLVNFDELYTPAELGRRVKGGRRSYHFVDAALFDLATSLWNARAETAVETRGIAALTSFGHAAAHLQRYIAVHGNKYAQSAR